MGQHEQLFCSLDTEGGPGMGGTGPHGIQAWRPAGAPGQDHTFRADDGRTHFNLLGWDGRGSARTFSRTGATVSETADLQARVGAAAVPDGRAVRRARRARRVRRDHFPRQARAAFGRFLAWLRATAPADVAQHYVQTFDLRRSCALYLTYYRYGDTRKRGLAMVAFKTAYRDAGFIPSEDELPDYLPMVLDFAALTGRGQRLLRSRRADLELLRRALAKAEIPLRGCRRRRLRAAAQAGPA